MMFGNAMYLRPGNLWKNFRVLKMHVDNVDGYAKNSYEDTGTIVDGILAQATSNERELTKHLWDQKLHSLTHTLVFEVLECNAVCFTQNIERHTA